MGYDAFGRAHNHAMTDAKGVLLASHDMQEVSTNLLDRCSLPDATSAQHSNCSGCGSFGLRDHRLHEALHGNYDFPRMYPCECPYGLSYWRIDGFSLAEVSTKARDDIEETESSSIPHSLALS